MSTPSNVKGPVLVRPPRRPPPAELERLLRHARSKEALPKEQRDHIAAELRSLRRTLERRTCSASWFWHCWESGESFPPPARTTPMVVCQCQRCQRSGRLWPAHYEAPADRSDTLESGFLSYECYLESLSDEQAAYLPSSPSGLALRAVREGRIKLRRQRTHTAARRFHS